MWLWRCRTSGARRRERRPRGPGSRGERPAEPQEAERDGQAGQPARRKAVHDDTLSFLPRGVPDSTPAVTTTTECPRRASSRARASTWTDDPLATGGKRLVNIATRRGAASI